MGAEPLTYTVPEAATLIGISPATYYELLNRGEVPGYAVGRRRVVPRQELHDYNTGGPAAWAAAKARRAATLDELAQRRHSA